MWQSLQSFGISISDSVPTCLDLGRCSCLQYNVCLLCTISHKAFSSSLLLCTLWERQWGGVRLGPCEGDTFGTFYILYNFLFMSGFINNRQWCKRFEWYTTVWVLWKFYFCSSFHSKYRGGKLSKQYTFWGLEYILWLILFFNSKK